MASTPPTRNEEHTPSSTPRFREPVRRTPSFSSLSPSHSRNSSFRSSSFSFSEESPPFSPTTPLKFKGIPFSWEQIPGIPKQQGCKKESSGHLLPPPPARNSNSSAGKFQLRQRDPFVTALVECSKDDEHEHGQRATNFGSSKNIITRSLSDRFGFTSCKTTCAVSESLVYVPRSRPHYQSSP